MRFLAALVAAISLHLQPHTSTPPPAVDYRAAVIYYMRTLPADEQIRIVFAGTPVVDKMLYIASRESMGDVRAPYTYDCAADNKRSSAAGLFQTLAKYHKTRAERLGFSWSDVAGPACYADTMLAFDLWREQGLQPWKVR